MKIVVLLASLTLGACQFSQDSLPDNTIAGIDYSAGVGTGYFHIVDENREEILTENPEDVRDILVKIWYPAKINPTAKPVPMWFHTQQQLLPFEGLDKPTAAIAKLLNTPSKSYLNAPLIKGNYPLVLFSHGYWSFLEQNQYLMEHLASQGYIVASVGHNYQAAAMMQSNGVMNFIDPAARDSDWFLSSKATVNADQLNTELESMRGVDLSEEQKQRVYQLTEWAAGDRQWIEYWGQDMNKVLQVFKQINQGDVSQLVKPSMDLAAFTHHLNIDKLAVVGGSMGGPVALDFCNTAPQCKAAINFDAMHYNLKRPQPNQENYQKPYMMLVAGPGVPAPVRLIMEQQRAETYVVNVAGAKHMNFTDNSILNNSDLGSIDGQRMIDLINTVVAGFLSNQLDSATPHTELLAILKHQPELTTRYQAAP